MMRFKLDATSSVPLTLSRSNTIPLSVTIRPANRTPGSFEYKTDSRSLLQLLSRETDLSGFALERFRNELQSLRQVSLPAVSLKDETLRQIGYFVD